MAATNRRLVNDDRRMDDEVNNLNEKIEHFGFGGKKSIFYR
jgi:hypothetical protein